MSGGVDSAVAAYLLKKQGYQVEGLYMQNWDSSLNNDLLGNPDLKATICPQERDYLDAKKVCEQLGIILHRKDFIEEYWNDVFTYFLNELKAYRTPNPDILCNKYIKFDAFLKEALKLKADYIATGHYVGYASGNLYKAKDLKKDQSYFLCQLTRKQLEKSIFPLANITKIEVRKIAASLDLVVKNKKDSTGICFIGERNFQAFLKNYLPNQPGKIITPNNEVLGEHQGLMYYTIGQRKGLGIGSNHLKNKDNRPWFVVKKDVEHNALIVEQGCENALLYSTSCLVKDINYLGSKPLKKLMAKFRYRQPDQEVFVKWIDQSNALVSFKKPQRAVTPGQACVFYKQNICLGGGFIDKVYRENKIFND